MRLDAFTLISGLAGLGSAAAALWLWTAPPPDAPPAPTPADPSQTLDRAALSAAFARFDPVEQPAEAAPVTTPRRPMRLIGVVESDDGRVAVIIVGDETVFLRPGEAAAGIELLALDSSLAVIAADGQERRLVLGG